MRTSNKKGFRRGSVLRRSCEPRASYRQGGGTDQRSGGADCLSQPGRLAYGWFDAISRPSRSRAFSAVTSALSGTSATQ